MTDTVLIVDDDPFISKAFKRSLSREAFETLTAESAAQALEILEQREVAVVVSDERMPGMSGSELMVKLRDHYPATVRILLTGYATLETAIEAINHGEVHRLLLKPCSLMELAAVIRRALACHVALQEIRLRLEALDGGARMAAALDQYQRDAISVLCPVGEEESSAKEPTACRGK